MEKETVAVLLVVISVQEYSEEMQLLSEKLVIPVTIVLSVALAMKKEKEVETIPIDISYEGINEDFPIYCTVELDKIVVIVQDTTEKDKRMRKLKNVTCKNLAQFLFVRY